MIQIHNLSVLFNKGSAAQTLALDHITLHIPPEQFVIVIGGNGAGKSTLLGALSGEALADKGHITIHGHDVTKWSVHKRARLVGRVFQDPLVGTCGELSIEENMSLAAQRGDSRTFTKAIGPRERKRFREALATLNLGLEERLQDPIGSLSGGQRQAISLLMAALSPMDILLLDEHTAALDPKTAAFILSLGRQIIEREKLTVLMVTHSLHQAIECGERLLMLHQGRLAMDVQGEDKRKLRPEDLFTAFEEL